MKKLLGIVVLCLWVIGNAYANCMGDNQINVKKGITEKSEFEILNNNDRLI